MTLIFSFLCSVHMFLLALAVLDLLFSLCVFKTCMLNGANKSDYFIKCPNILSSQSVLILYSVYLYVFSLCTSEPSTYSLPVSIHLTYGHPISVPLTYDLLVSVPLTCLCTSDLWSSCLHTPDL